MARTYRLAELSWGNSSIRFSNRENDPQAQHHLTNLKGWFGGVGVKGENQARLGHGDFQSRKHRGPRVIVLEATLNYPNEDARSEADRFVSGILWDGQPGFLTVTTGSQTLHTEVELDGDIAHEYIGLTATKIQIPLKANDSFLYEEAKTYQLFPSGFGEGLEFPLFSPNGILHYGFSVASSKTIIQNEGNAEAWPVFITQMNFPSGLRIDDGRGNIIELPMFISQTQDVRINTQDGSVLVNGVDFSHVLTRKQWFSVAPGESIQPRITSLQEGDGFVNVELSNTYI